MDQEDKNFLKNIAEELMKIDPEMYKAEAEELENIIYRENQSQNVLNEEEYYMAQTGNEESYPTYQEYLDRVL